MDRMESYVRKIIIARERAGVKYIKKDSHMTVVTVFFNYKLIIKNKFVFY